MAVNESLAHVSNDLVYSAIAVYTAAMLAYAAEWAFGTRSRVGRQAASLGAESGDAAESASASSGVAAASSARTAGGVAVATRTELVTSKRPPGDDDQPTVAGESARADTFGRMAVALTVLAFLMHGGGVVTRAFAAGRAPWGNMYEFSVTSALAVTGAYLVLLTRRQVRWMGLFVVALVLITLGVAVTLLYTDAEQLVPALQSYWIWIHVSAAMLSGGAFALGGVASCLFLAKDGYERRVVARRPVRFAGMMERLPSATSLDNVAYRTNAFVFPVWTFAIIAGAIWADSAWGRFWGWDPKETWAFITWVVYAAYLHARVTVGWKGRAAAYIGIVGFLCFIFNYFIINLFVTGMHSYAGVSG